MRLFKIAKLELIMFCFSMFFVGWFTDQAIVKASWVPLIGVVLHLPLTFFWLYRLSSKLVDRMVMVTEIYATREQAKLIVGLHSKGAILDPDMDNAVDLSKRFIDELDEGMRRAQEGKL